MKKMKKFLLTALAAAPDGRHLGALRAPRGERSAAVLMLFTDGLVETSDRDIVEGIDRLTGEADRYVAGGFHGAAWHLIEAVAKDVNDDRALLLICRESAAHAR